MKKENIKKASYLNSEIIDLKAERNKLKAFKGNKFKLDLKMFFSAKCELDLNLDLLLDANIKLLQEEIDPLEKSLDLLLNEKELLNK